MLAVSMRKAPKWDNVAKFYHRVVIFFKGGLHFGIGITAERLGALRKRGGFFS